MSAPSRRDSESEEGFNRVREETPISRMIRGLAGLLAHGG